MGNCKIKKGIFVQRACGRSTDITCDVCKIEVCDKHSKIIKGAVICHNCYQKNYQRKKNNSVDLIERDFYWWYWSTRHTYYDKYDSYPVFDTEDYGSFDQISNEGYDENADIDDFFDS